ALKRLDYKMDKELHGLRTRTFVSENQLDQHLLEMIDAKERIVRTYFDQPVHGVRFSAFYFDLYCVDKQIDEARKDIDAGFPGAVPVPMAAAEACLTDLRKKLER